MIQFKCQQCQESLEAPLSLEGENLSCPKCGFDQAIPAPLSGGDSVNRSDPITVGLSEEPKDPYTTNEETTVEAEADTGGHRPIFINSIGEIIMTENSKSVACPMQDHRCRYSCAWFSIDHEANTALCQGRIVIGGISRNEYGREDDKTTNRW